MMDYLQIISAILILMFISGVFKCFKQLFRTLHLRKSGVKTSAIIVDFEKEENLDGINYFPILRFRTNNGDTIEIKIDEARSIKPKIGKEISIYYNDADPHELTINNKWFIVLNLFAIIAQLYVIVYFTYYLIYSEWLF